MKNTTPPFWLGETLSGTDDNDNLINQEVLGQIHEFPARRYGAGGAGQKVGRTTGRMIKAIALRNVSGLTLYGKRLAVLEKASEDSYGISNVAITHEVDGYAEDTAQKNVVFIDEFIEDNGVADDDIFWGIIEGPFTAKSQATEASGNTMAYGDALVAGTGAATSGNSTAGGVVGHSAGEAGMLVGIACTTYDNTSLTMTDVPIIAKVSLI